MAIKKDDEFMTVGELAGRMGITVRTLQYYDREGILSPAAVSSGGRRLYTDKDMVKLHQILSLKSLGFSLGDIKNKLVPLETPGEIAEMLSEQAQLVREKVEELSNTLHVIDALKKEILYMKTVDFKKYADIVTLLQMKNDSYWVMKFFDDNMWEHISTRFDKERGEAFMEEYNGLCDECGVLIDENTEPESERGQEFARRWWDMVMDFIDGDMKLLPQLMKFAEQKDGWDDDWRCRQVLVDDYLEKALAAYFMRLGKNPFEEIEHECD